MSNLVICLGISGFPDLRTASVKKAIYLSKIITDAGDNVLVVNSEAVYDDTYKNIRLNGTYEGVDFCSTLKNVRRKKSFLGKRIPAYLNKAKELAFLMFNRSASLASHAILFTSGSFWDLLVYRLVSRIKGFKLIIVYHEFRSDFDYRKNNFFLRLNDRLFDRHFFRFVDGVLPISEYLITHLRAQHCNKPVLKIPVLIDVLKYPVKEKDEPFFLFCGSAGFRDSVEFVIRSYELCSDPTIKLCLVLSGQKDYVIRRINKSPKKGLIAILSDISDEELFKLYVSATALLIPLKKEPRDLARFPQKIAEYACSGNPIISMNYGEMSYYFKDEESALLCNEYNTESFAEKMDFVTKNPDLSGKIGNQGLEVGLASFNYMNYKEELKKFLSNLKNR